MTTVHRPFKSKRSARGSARIDHHSPPALHSPAFSDYLAVSAADLGKGQPVKVRVLTDAQSLSQDLAKAMLSEIHRCELAGRGATLIVPVGPVEQFPLLARLINEQKLSCRNTVFINMDEYLTDSDDWISPENPLSFRGYMD